MVNQLKRIFRYTGFDYPRRLKFDNTPIIIGTWKIPCYTSSSSIDTEKFETIKSITRANRYLRHQQRRIDEAVRCGNYRLAIHVFTVLMRRSKSFRVSFLNRVAKGWYHSLTKADLKSVWNKLDRICKNFDTNLRSKRVYIPKGDGRLRPLGVPTLEWRIYISMWTDFMYMLIGMEIPHWQHAFMPGKSVLSAWKHVLEELDKLGDNARVWEFDLDGFFNRVSLKELVRELEGYEVPKPVVNFLKQVLTMYPLIPWYKLKEEKEIKMVTRRIRGFVEEDERVATKSGFPQGLPISPFLSSFVTAACYKTMGISPIMYADDGLIISSSEIPFKNLSSPYPEGYGLHLATKKKKDGRPATGEVEEIIDFLGLKYNFKTQCFKIEDSWIPRSKVSDGMLKGVAWKGYANQDPNWKWDPKPTSVLLTDVYNSIFTIENWRNGVVWLMNLLKGKRGHIHRFGLKFVDVQSSSTFSCGLLLEGCLTDIARKLKLEPKPKSSKFRFGEKFGESETVKGTFNFAYPQGVYNFQYYQPKAKHPSLVRDEEVRGYLYKKYFEENRTTLLDPSTPLQGPYDHW